MIQQFIMIELDKARNLRYNSLAIKKLEEIMGMSSIKYLKSIGEKVEDMRIEEYITLLWLGLIWEDKELTLDKCYDLWDIALEKYGFDESIEKVITSISNYFGLKEEKSKSLEGRTKASKKK